MSKVIPYFIKIINLNSEHRLCCVLYSVAQSCPTAKPWTVAHQASLSMGVLQARILELVAIPSSRDLPNPGIQPRSPILQVDSLSAKPPGKPTLLIITLNRYSDSSGKDGDFKNRLN